jgi:hypothetical protein
LRRRSIQEASEQARRGLRDKSGGPYERYPGVDLGSFNSIFPGLRSGMISQRERRLAVTIKAIETEEGIISSLVFEAGERLDSHSKFFDAIMSTPTNTISVDKANIAGEFFNLKTGFAGEVLQKVSNYRKRLVILGDFEKVESKSLRDFIYESNRTGKVLFVDTLEKAVKLLK